MEKLAYDRLKSCRGFNFHILLNSWSLMSLTFWPVAQFGNFNSEWFLDQIKKCSHKYEKWTDVTIGASNAYWQKTSVLNFLNFRILRTLPHTTESHLKAIGLADWLLCLWLNVLTQAGADCCLALRSPVSQAAQLSSWLCYPSFWQYVWSMLLKSSRKWLILILWWQ